MNDRTVRNVAVKGAAAKNTDDRNVVVVKIGSQILLNSHGHLDLSFIDSIAAQIAALVAMGKSPVIVSSGAIACGRSTLQTLHSSSPQIQATVDSLSERQALAAIGQAQLAHRWSIALSARGLLAAQILLTNDDFQQRIRYLNMTATFRSLFEKSVVPVVNENDTVAVEELTVGDNDRLSSMLAGQLHAERLIILTDIDGVYAQDPRKYPDAELLTSIEKIDDTFIQQTGGASGSIGRGGMRSKLVAAQIASEAGVQSHIVHGREDQVIARVCQGQAVGTAIPARSDHSPDARRLWLALARRPEGAVHLDAGAIQALQEKGTSLLPVGITHVIGAFARGDTISICDHNAKERARGLSNYTSEELTKIHGQRRDIATETLGYILPKTAVHRDNLLILQQ